MLLIPGVNVNLCENRNNTPCIFVTSVAWKRKLGLPGLAHYEIPSDWQSDYVFQSNKVCSTQYVWHVFSWGFFGISKVIKQKLHSGCSSLNHQQISSWWNEAPLHSVKPPDQALFGAGRDAGPLYMPGSLQTVDRSRCGKASCQICWISFTMDSSNFPHFQGRQQEQAGCQISLGSKIFRRAGWEKHQILSDLICLVQSRRGWSLVDTGWNTPTMPHPLALTATHFLSQTKWVCLCHRDQVEVNKRTRDNSESAFTYGNCDKSIITHSLQAVNLYLHLLAAEIAVARISFPAWTQNKINDGGQALT